MAFVGAAMPGAFLDHLGEGLWLREGLRVRRFVADRQVAQAGAACLIGREHCATR